MKSKKVKSQEEEEFVPKAFKKEKSNVTQKNKKSRRGKTNKNKKVKKIIISLIVLLVIVIGITLATSAVKWRNIAEDMLINENSIVLDNNGNELAKLGSERKQIKIDISQMPANLKNAYVAIEDERFYKHQGVDIKRTGSAILSYIFHFGNSSYGYV